LFVNPVPDLRTRTCSQTQCTGASTPHPQLPGSGTTFFRLKTESRAYGCPDHPAMKSNTPGHLVGWPTDASRAFRSRWLQSSSSGLGALGPAEAHPATWGVMAKDLHAAKRRLALRPSPRVEAILTSWANGPLCQGWFLRPSRGEATGPSRLPEWPSLSGGTLGFGVPETMT